MATDDAGIQQINVTDTGRKCRKCGYNLTGLEELRCPECGTPFAPDKTCQLCGKRMDSGSKFQFCILCRKKRREPVIWIVCGLIMSAACILVIPVTFGILDAISQPDRRSVIPFPSRRGLASIAFLLIQCPLTLVGGIAGFIGSGLGKASWPFKVGLIYLALALIVSIAALAFRVR